MGIIKALRSLKEKKEKSRPFCSAVVVAAGNSTRMGENKLFIPICGVPLLAVTLINLSQCGEIDEIVVVAKGDDILPVGNLVKDYNIGKVKHIVTGGETRTLSVLAGISAVSKDAEIIAIHDGARPFALPELCSEAIKAAELYRAAAPAVPVKDTIKICRNGVIDSTPDRELLYQIQTPQVFQADLIRTALYAAKESGISYTDDCAAVEKTGIRVVITPGSYLNMKVTTREDITIASAIMEELNA